MHSRVLTNVLILACILVLSFTALAGPPEGVYLYEHSDFGGRWIRVTDDVNNLGKYNFNDTISAIRIVGNYEVTVYEHTHYSGWSRTYYDDTAYVGNRENDQISSLQITRKSRHHRRSDGPGPGYDPGPKSHQSPGVYFYEHSDFGGKWIRVTDDVANLANYNFNDMVSSIKIIGRYKVKVYQHANFGGWSRDYHEDTRFVGDAVNEQISSVRIRRF